MAAHDFTEPDDNIEVFTGRPNGCFLCGNKLDPRRVVFWHGFPHDPDDETADCPTIFLHPLCAQSLGCHLIGDAIRATNPITCRQVRGWERETTP